MNQQPYKLKQSFYTRPTLEVCRDLLGKFVVYESGKSRLSARIVETEAYIGEDDPACHAAPGLTERNRIMYGPAGFAYVYLIYGMYYCLNFVSEAADRPAAVLLRAAEPCEGVDLMHKNSPGKKDRELLNGPGKFCRSFGLSTEHNCLDLTGDSLYLEERFHGVNNVVQSTRIGIRFGKELPYRFYDGDSDAISVIVKNQ